LLKDTGRETLFHTIRAAARGKTLLGPEVMARLLARTAQAAAPQAVGEAVLTERDLEVLTAVARGDRNKEIARQLDVTERTVKAHLTSIYNKPGVDSRAAAVSVSIQRGLVR
jgi:NarL family two-component system response regulator YdfI